LQQILMSGVSKRLTLSSAKMTQVTGVAEMRSSARRYPVNIDAAAAPGRSGDPLPAGIAATAIVVISLLLWVIIAAGVRAVW
jgi:hypothetical protein